MVLLVISWLHENAKAISTPCSTIWSLTSNLSYRLQASSGLSVMTTAAKDRLFCPGLLSYCVSRLGVLNVFLKLSCFLVKMDFSGYNLEVNQGISVCRGQAHIHNKGSKEMGRKERERGRKVEKRRKGGREGERRGRGQQRWEAGVAAV